MTKDARTSTAPADDEVPRVLRISRRGFLWQAAAGTTGWTLVRRARAESAQQRELAAQHGLAEELRVLLECRPFASSVRQLFPVIAGKDSRLVAISDTGSLAIWAIPPATEQLAEGSAANTAARNTKPLFSGEPSCCPGILLSDDCRPSAAVPETPETPSPAPPAKHVNPLICRSDDLSVTAFYSKANQTMTLSRGERPVIHLQLDPQRGALTAMGLGKDGRALATAQEGGGILLFRIGDEGAELIGEFSDESHCRTRAFSATDTQAEAWRFLPCTCDSVAAAGDSPYAIDTRDFQGSSISEYDSVTGLRTWTQACGSAIPPGAVCTCNCVRAPAVSLPRHRCLCDQVCTCDTVARQQCICDPVTSKRSGCHWVRTEQLCSCDQVATTQCTCDSVKTQYCSCDKVCTCDLVYY